MKTPRELLLHEHRHTARQLDTVRHKVVKSLAGEAQMGEPVREASDGFLATTWQELFVGCRRWWAGLAVAWCVVMAFMVLDSAEPLQRSVLAVATSEPAIEALQERRQLQAELLGIASNHQRPDPHSKLGPRSDIRFEQRYA